MNMEAFFRQGFITFESALLEEASTLDAAIPAIRESVLGTAATVVRPERLTFVGIGASLAALAAPVAYLRSNGITAWRVNAAEIEELDTGDVMIALSQSGRSRETVEVLRRASGAKIAVVNVTDSPLANAADSVLSLGDLPDSLASTIGFSASAIAISMLCEAWTVGSPSADWSTLGERLAEFIEKISDDVDRALLMLGESSVIDVVAPADQFGAAEVTALLLREVARVPAAPFEGRQYLHGLMEATGATTFHVVFDGPDTRQIVPSLLKLDRRVLLLGGEAGIEREDSAVFRVALPALSMLETPVFIAAFVQQLALRSAVGRGIDPDEFRFLETDTKLGDNE